MRNEPRSESVAAQRAGGTARKRVEVPPSTKPADKALIVMGPTALYSELNLAVVYHDDGRMQVSAGPDACTSECVGGGIATLNPHPKRSQWIELTAA